MKKSRSRAIRNLSDYLVNAVARGVLWAALRLPYRWRVPLFGWLVSRAIAPLAGYRRRVRDNLKYVCPEMPPAQVARIVRGAPDNLGRFLIELFSGRQFLEHVQDVPLSGEGTRALEQAHAAHLPVILVSGHFGNLEVPRAALLARGYRVGGVFTPMKNKFFAARFERAFKMIGTPVFRRNRRGLGEMLRFLRDGGMVGFLLDQHMSGGADLKFFGKPARTALSAAELALKHQALLVPIYGIRQPNGLDFSILVEAPIAHTTATEMTQALNDSLENMVRQHMDQWLWMHRRWKPERMAARLSAAAPPRKPAPDRPPAK
ncbi:MAG: lysophospholipid acyltransferase family protein [Paracoccaceae bacterium]